MNAQSPSLFEAPLAHEAVHYTNPYTNLEFYSNPEEEFEGEMSHEAAGERDYFVTKILPGFPEGHEVLTRHAAAGLPGIDMRALLIGVTRVDKGERLRDLPSSLVHSVVGGEQHRHALRMYLSSPMGSALAEIRRHLRILHSRALVAACAGASRTAFLWIGEALHLIQDSYSSAHIQRDFGRGPGGSHPIRYIRFYANVKINPFPHLPTFTRGRGPREHNFPTDPRDSIRVPGGALKPEARVAIAASREFLGMMLRQMADPRSPRNAVELRAYMNKHLSF
jgi:hypothetical protein